MLNEMFEGEVADFQKYYLKRKRSDSEKYQDAVDKQQAGHAEWDPLVAQDNEDAITDLVMDLEDDEVERAVRDWLNRTQKDVDPVIWLKQWRNENLNEAKLAWARRGKKIVRKYRCTSGRRKGRIVSNPSQCSKPVNIKKRQQLKRTKAKMGSRMARKAKRTKRVNPASRRLKRLNK